MKYVSTRGSAPTLSFEDAMMTGLARDGGLYVPETWPTLDAEQIAELAGKSYEDVAFAIMRPFIGDAFSDDTFRTIIERAYSVFTHDARCPLKQLAPNHFLLELFHGPTLAFKDVAMQLIGHMFETKLRERGEKLTIVGATSGDTGSAAIEAFANLSAVDVFIMYPHGRVSDVQRRQMTTPIAANVHALAIDGDFDDCQAHLKGMFNHFEFRDRVQLAGVNSINWARVLAQVVYFFTSALSLGAPARKVTFTVPSGNFGDIFAGFVAQKMGLPIEKLIIATNQNDILHRTLETGTYSKSPVIPSTSPSMDIQVSSNFERLLFELYGREGKAVNQLMDELSETGSFTLSQGALTELRGLFGSDHALEPDVDATIIATHMGTGEVICPHTACGVFASDKLRSKTPVITLATAHPAKFPDAVEAAIGQRPELPSKMGYLMDMDERVTRLPNDQGAIEALILERTGH